MKNPFRFRSRLLRRTLLASGLSLLGLTTQAQVGIGTTAPNVSAMLELSTTNKGLLLPRLTLVQRDAIGSPAAGLMIYQTDNTPGLYLYGGSSWSLLPNAAQTTAADNLGNHTATQALNLGTNTLVGQTSSIAAVGTTGLQVNSDGGVNVGTVRALGADDFRAGLEVNSSAGLLAIGTHVGNRPPTPLNGSGTRLMWLPASSSFRAGYVNGTEWDYVNIGAYSVAMGYNCRASGDYATALGNGCIAPQVNAFAVGEGNTASGANSVALGYYAHTNARQGSFVFADRSNYPNGTSSGSVNDFRAGANHTFNVRASGGYFLYSNAAASIGVTVAAGGNAWTTLSDSTRKERLRLADGNELLRRVGLMRLGSWNYKGQSADTMRHYGPMAQDFFAAFGHDGVGRVGHAKGINQADFDGVNLILIQALYRQVQALEADNRTLRAQAAATIHTVEARLRALEARPGSGAAAALPVTAGLK